MWKSLLRWITGAVVRVTVLLALAVLGVAYIVVSVRNRYLKETE